MSVSSDDEIDEVLRALEDNGDETNCYWIEDKLKEFNRKRKGLIQCATKDRNCSL